MVENIIFPLAGLGKRFQKAGYIQTKPLIHAGSKTIIEWSLESIQITENVNVIFVIRKDQSIRHGIDSYLKKLFPKCTLVELDQATNGSLETVVKAIEKLNLKGHLHIHTSDLVLPNPIKLGLPFKEETSIEAVSYTFKANSPNYSYCKLKDGNLIEDMIEKEIISQTANIGIYSFRSIDKFINYSKKIINNERKIKNEYYISSVFGDLIKDGNNVRSQNVEEVHVIGTPSELIFFTKFVIPTMNPVNIGFVSDHSGFNFKENLIKLFKESGYSTVDYGCFSNRSCDYSDYIPIACEGLDRFEVDIVMGSCRSGQGMNICANHQKNIISVTPNNKESLLYSRKHNCPNFISFASSIWDSREAFDAFDETFQKSHFEGGRHSTRIQKFLNYI